MDYLIIFNKTTKRYTIVYFLSDYGQGTILMASQISLDFKKYHLKTRVSNSLKQFSVSDTGFNEHLS